MKATPFFDVNGQPSEPLLKLLERLGVQHDGTLKSIRDATQEAWYQAGKLRAEIKDTVEQGQLHNDVVGHFSQLGMMHAVESEGSYEYALLLGATVAAVRKRLAFLRTQWEKGLLFKELVLLGSERDLIPEKEGHDVLFNPKNAELPFPEVRAKTAEAPPRNEIEMMEMVCQQADFPWDNRVRVTPVRTPGRANTSVTVQQWLKDAQPEPGTCLAMSSQPFVSFQTLVVEKELKKHNNRFSVDGIGYASLTLPVATYLDNVAKVIYELAESECV
ncbi:hypothetical protein H6770_03655 [Candidatus Peribacteria bacterium]|nr:hypothetical protein [Candidatus Peribacteria bacterium]